MRQWCTVIKAFWTRDLTITASYRLNFLFQILTTFMSTVMIYFFSKLVGNHIVVEKYGGYLSFSIIGIALTGYFTTGFSSFSSAVQSEQSTGTLEYLLMTPMKLSKVIIASSAWEFCWTTFNALIVLTVASLLFDIDIKGNLFLAFIVLFLTTLSFICLGILSASFVMVFKRGDPLKIIVTMTTYILGGVTYPISLFPGWMQKLSNVLPVTHGLSALRDILLIGKTFTAIWPQVMVLLIFALVGLPLSLLVFNRATNIARREGTLLHY